VSLKASILRNKNLVVATFGKHGVRTPFSYERYNSCFRKFGMVLDNENEKPDILCSGFHIDIPAESERIFAIKKRNPAVKIFIISEEPLWDLTWHNDPFSFKQKCKVTGLEYFYINHYNCNAFEISKLPYFITTDTKYTARYLMLLSRFKNLTPTDLISHWHNCRYLISCFVENRQDEKYSVNKNGFIAHSNLRTHLAASVYHNKIAQVQGKGWGTDTPRQSLPDWHADKLTRTYKCSKYLMAIENTDAPSYITEKVFDAFCSLAIPVIVTSQLGELEKLICSPAAIEVDSRDIDEFGNKLKVFTTNQSFAERYLKNIRQLHSIFRNVENIEKAVFKYTESFANEIKKAI
jgi:hypothetical protein